MESGTEKRQSVRGARQARLEETARRRIPAPLRRPGRRLAALGEEVDVEAVAAANQARDARSPSLPPTSAFHRSCPPCSRPRTCCWRCSMRAIRWAAAYRWRTRCSPSAEEARGADPEQGGPGWADVTQRWLTYLASTSRPSPSRRRRRAAAARDLDGELRGWSASSTRTAARRTAATGCCSC